MIRVIYLTFLEGIFNYGIFESQVKTLLFTLKRKYNSQLDLLLVVNMPLINLTRKGPVFNFIKYRREKKAIVEEFKSHGAALKLIPVYLPFLNRWGIHLNIFLLALVFILNFPFLLLTILKFKPDILHCRSYPAALVGLLVKCLDRNLKLIFDMRGLFPEEGIVQKRWNEKSLTFKIWKKLEYLLLRHSDRIIALSEPFREYVSSLNPDCTPKIELIYASVDIDFFKPDPSGREILLQKLGLEGKKIFMYHGSLNSWHSPELLGLVFKKIKEKIFDAHLLILTTFNRERLSATLQSLGLSKSDFSITWVRFSEMPSYLSLGRYAIVPSNILNFPEELILDTMIGLKVSECLALGLPLIANENIGGLRPFLSENGLGTSFRAENIDELPSRIQYLESRYDEISRNCIKFAWNFLNIERSADCYFKIYKELNNTKTSQFS